MRRGRNVECPRCRFPAFVLLRELDEHVRCRGCTLEYLLEVSGPGGEEAKPAYRLDGLMARLMDRHVLPVLLALRARHDPARHWSPQHVWPGVLFKAAGARPFDVDLVASDGREVFVAECKLDGRGLGMPQLRGLLTFCARVGATPVVAALAGEFTAKVRREVEACDGLVLERPDMLTIGKRPSFQWRTSSPRSRMRDDFWEFGTPNRRGQSVPNCANRGGAATSNDGYARAVVSRQPSPRV